MTRRSTDTEHMHSTILSLLASFALASSPSPKVCGKDLLRNDLLSTPGICGTIDAVCISKIDFKDISRPCLSHLNDEARANLDPKTANEILNGQLLDIPSDGPLLAALFKRNDWAKHKHEAFLKAAAEIKEYSNAIAEALKAEPDHFAKFFTGDNAANHSSACEKLTQDTVSAISTTFFAKMSKACFKKIPAEAMAGLDSDRMAALRPELLLDITVAQAAKLPNDAFMGMTADHIKSWGTVYSPPKGTDKDSVQAYLDAHPCSQAPRMIATVKADLRKNLKIHCQLVDGAAGMGRLKYSSTLLGVTMLIGVALAL